jgi:hypothetical protein
MMLQMLSDLRAERQQIEEAILVLERLASSGGRRRGRPPKWMAQVQPEVATSIRKKSVFSLATRQKMAAAQRRRWAKRRADAT